MNRSQPTGRAPLASSPAIPDPRPCPGGRTLGFAGRGCRRILGLLLLGLAALASGCSTMTVGLKGFGDRGMNPAVSGGEGAAATEGAPLDVFVFFLKRRETFDSRPFRELLTPEVRKIGKVPDALAADAAAVYQDSAPVQVCPRLRIVPGQTDHKVTEYEVSKEARFVGLVASFQDHIDGDAKEVWRLVLPIEDWVVRFYVRGKRLDAKPADPAVAKPAPAPTTTPEQAK